MIWKIGFWANPNPWNRTPQSHRFEAIGLEMQHLIPGCVCVPKTSVTFMKGLNVSSHPQYQAEAMWLSHGSAESSGLRETLLILNREADSFIRLVRWWYWHVPLWKEGWGFISNCCRLTKRGRCMIASSVVICMEYEGEVHKYQACVCWIWRKTQLVFDMQRNSHLLFVMCCFAPNAV